MSVHRLRATTDRVMAKGSEERVTIRLSLNGPYGYSDASLTGEQAGSNRECPPMNITDIEHGDVGSIDRIVSNTDPDEASASPKKPSDSTTEIAAVLATVRDINETAVSVSLRRADTGEILTDIDVEALRPAPAATDEDQTQAGFTDDESGE